MTQGPSKTHWETFAVSINSDFFTSRIPNVFEEEEEMLLFISFPIGGVQ